ncbi:hypothetical protein CPV29_23980 [Salmonella enterica]|nr:hypothetical protein [Salmonella enterica]
MIKLTVSAIIISLLTMFSSTVWSVRPDSFFASTVFTVAGIMFSIGLGLIVTFNPSGVKNTNYLRAIRSNVAKVRNSFLLHFGLSTLCYIINQYVAGHEFSFFLLQKVTILFSISIFLCLVMIYCAIYFIINFIELQRLNNDIFDEVNKESR